MSILSDHDITLELAAGHLEISNLDESMIQPASVDLKLGEGFIRPIGGEINLNGMVVETSALCERYEDSLPYRLAPRCFVLGTTLERVKIPVDCVARVEGKSSLGRLGLCVHATAGFIDPGFEGQITLEFYNMGPSTLFLYPGHPICQLALERLESPAKRPYGTWGLGSKYQGQIGVTGSKLGTPKLPPDYKLRDRVFHRRADLFGTIIEFDTIGAASARVKYEWPMSCNAEPVVVPLRELMHAHDAPGGHD